MVKSNTEYVCQQCGAITAKWSGQCGQCQAWNTLAEEQKRVSKPARFAGYADTQSDVCLLADVVLQDEIRLKTGLTELDRVLGGGLVAGSVVLIGGDPGIGKSTLLLQSLAHLSSQQTVLYVTGEESLAQVRLRAERLNLQADQIHVLTETEVEQIITLAKRQKPRVIVIDSIQTMHTHLLNSAAGSVGQVRDSAAQLVQYAKQNDTTLLLVGHVTKEGALAGPRVLEHMVDAVLYFEGQSDSRFRVIRAIKNRFGAVNELGVFAMTHQGLREVSNPSALFLSRASTPAAGSVVMVTWEGTRPLLVEVQALVDDSQLANPRRLTLGLEHNRLSMLLAVLHRHAGISGMQRDVFVNIVGGIRVSETAADLAVLLAVLSSLRDKALPQDLIVFGEVGLSGEIRPIQYGVERLREAAKHGFSKAIIPQANTKQADVDLELYPLTHVQQVLQYC